MEALLSAHSLLRYIALALLVITVVRAALGWFGDKPFTPGDKKLALFTLISFHLMFLIGLVLFFWGPNVGVAERGLEVMKDSREMRFFMMEHSTMMLVAAVLITIGNSRSKKAATSIKKFKNLAIFFGISLLLVLVAIPWPFSSVARQWFPF